ncbi:MAG: diguanylate cyclase [Burkholderiales bacterium]
MSAPLNPTEIARQTLIQLASRRLAPTPDNFKEIYHGISGTKAEESEQPIDRKLAEFARGLPDDNTGKTTRKVLEEALALRDWPSARRAMLVLARYSSAGSGPVADLSRDALRGLLRNFDAPHEGWTQEAKFASLRLLIENSDQPLPLGDALPLLAESWKDPSAAISACGHPTDPGTGLPQDLAGDIAAPLRACLILALETTLPGLLRHAPDLAWEANRLAARVREAAGTEAFSRIGVDLKEFTHRIELHGGGESETREGLLRLLRLLIENIDAMVEGDHWLQGQLAIVKAVLEQSLTPEVLDRAERAIRDLMHKQSVLKRSVEEAKENIKTLLQEFMLRLVSMSESTGDYQKKLETYTEKLRKPASIETLTTMVGDLLKETQDMKTSAEASHVALNTAQERVGAAELRIKQMEKELEQLTERAREDALTGTLNRRGLDEAFKREAGRADRQNTSMCVAVVDIDNFKQLNDSLGHTVGDQALQHIASVIKKHLRPEDALARYGGEEFVVLLPDSDLDKAVGVMVRLQRELTKEFFLHNKERLLITFSGGVSERRHGEELEPAVERADRAMYKAKRSGKNRVVADTSSANPVPATSLSQAAHS